MGLKGYRLWVMGQLDSNVQRPTVGMRGVMRSSNAVSAGASAGDGGISPAVAYTASFAAAQRAFKRGASPDSGPLARSATSV